MRKNFGKIGCCLSGSQCGTCSGRRPRSCIGLNKKSPDKEGLKMLYVNRPGFQTYRMEPQSDIDEEYLQRRIQEEAGPVKTYPIVEWFERQTSHYRRGQPFVVLTEDKIRMSRAAHQALGEPRFVRIGWDNVVNCLVLAAGSEEDERS